jgi:hypothetical protein
MSSVGFFYSLVLYFIRTCFCVLIVVHFVFCLFLYNTHNTNIHDPGGIRTGSPSNLSGADPRRRARPLRWAEMYLLNHNLQRDVTTLELCYLLRWKGKCTGNAWRIDSADKKSSSFHPVMSILAPWPISNPFSFQTSICFSRQFLCENLVRGKKWYWIKPGILWHWLGSALASRVPRKELTTNPILSSQFLQGFSVAHVQKRKTNF